MGFRIVSAITSCALLFLGGFIGAGYVFVARDPIYIIAMTVAVVVGSIAAGILARRTSR
jgi:hypothetical protein